jgi:hypothetical protein
MVLDFLCDDEFSMSISSIIFKLLTFMFDSAFNLSTTSKIDGRLSGSISQHSKR